MKEYEKSLNSLKIDFEDKIKDANRTISNSTKLELTKKLIKLEFEFNKTKIELEYEFQDRIYQLEKNFEREKSEILSKIALLEKESEQSPSQNKESESKEHGKNEKFKITSSFVIFIPLIVLFLGSFLLLNSNSNPKKTEIEIELDKLKIKLRTEYDTKYFTTYKLPENEIVKNKKGSYYKIDLKFSAYEELILFPKGKYYMETDNKLLRESITKFREKVYNVLDNNIETELFIKGTADILGNNTFQSKFLAPYDIKSKFNIIDYLPLDITENKYSTTQKKQEISEPIKNENLPNLRAKFMQKLIIEGNPDWPIPSILEGNVKNVESDRERNAYLILFINWDKDKEPKRENKTIKYVALGLIISSILALFAMIVYFLKKRMI